MEDLNFTSEVVTAERLHVYAQKYLTAYPTLSRNLKIESCVDPILQDLVYTLSSWCIAGKIPTNERTETIVWADGPWEAFKERYFPRWLLRRLPVKFAKKTLVVETNHYFVCPHINVPDSHQHIQFMATGSPIAARLSRY